MPRGKCVLGIDFGTESGRTVLVSVKNGRELASTVYEYADGVIDEYLPGTKIKLDPDFALQNPEDYIRTLKKTIPAVLRQAKVDASDVIGISTDFTACTMLPIDKDGTALCQIDRFRKIPNAWVKLWKHHASQSEADKINAVARQRGEDFLNRYGGKISSEWMIAKIWQTLDEAPEVYEAADKFVEAADWIVFKLTGRMKRNACTAGYKALWDADEGYPSNDYFKALDPRLENMVDEKLSRDIYPLGQKAGELTTETAKLTGLKEGTPVAVGNVDAHVAVPACTVTDVGKMVMIMGTSICHMVCGTEKKIVEGMCGVVREGILPGLYGFEAGQTGVGDIYAWFVQNCVPPEYHREARKKKISLHELLERKASKLKVGQSGLLALDWWNGNRSILVDTDLTGLLLGMTLATKPEEIYRALIEATAFGTLKIISAFESSGVKVNEIYCCGGLAQKNEMLMQIFADVTERPLKVAESLHTSALGSAMFAAVAAGVAGGGYETIADAARAMARIKKKVYRPDNRRSRVYRMLYKEYETLHDYFGRASNDVMKRIKRTKLEASKS